MMQTKRIRHEGMWRTYHLYVPSSYDPREAMPMVVALHRFTENGTTMALQTGFNRLAEREGFLVAYPDGFATIYNSFMDFGPNSVGFIENVVDRIEKLYNIDDERIYATGASSGGFMTFRLACESADIFAAFAPVVATMPADIADQTVPDRGLPILIIHGTDDPIVPPYSDYPLLGPAEGIRMYPIPDAVDYWVDANGCDRVPVFETIPDINPADGTTAFCETWGGGRDDSEVILYTVEKGGHSWPGGMELLPDMVVGKQNQDFSATEAIWEFFSRHKLPLKSEE